MFNNDELGTLPEAGADESMGRSSAMGISNSSLLHQRTTSLSVSDRNIGHYNGGDSYSGRGYDSSSVFDELPPYPGTAKWSRRSGV